MLERPADVLTLIGKRVYEQHTGHKPINQVKKMTKQQASKIIQLESKAARWYSQPIAKYRIIDVIHTSSQHKHMATSEKH